MWLETPIQDPKHFLFTFRHDPHDFLDHRVIESNFRTSLFKVLMNIVHCILSNRFQLIV